MSKRLIFLTSFVLVLSLVCNASAQGTGSIMREVWEGIGGVLASDLTGNANYPDNPTWGSLVTSLEQPEGDLGSDFGERIHGFLHPATSGDYTFWIAADDGCELLLSTDDDPANAVSIAGHASWTGSREFDSMPEQMSAPVALEAGGKYYILAIVKEAGGGDNLAVAWQGPDSPERTVIDGSFLSPAPWNIVLLKAKDPNPADGAVDADTVSLEWGAGPTAVSHKVYLSTDETIDESDLVAETDMAMHFAALDVGAAYYWRVDEVEADGTVIEGNLWSFTTLPLEAHFPSPADGAMEIKSGATLSWTAGKGVIMHDVYYGTDEALVAAADPSTFKGKVMVTSFDPGAFEAAVTYYWKIDEFSVTGTNPGPVWSFTGFDPDVASEPDPANGAVDVDSMPVLSWVAGETATLHDVYFGTDAALVEASDASVSQGQLTEASFAPADALDRGITYYWKVDITTGTARDSVFHPGKVWSLRVVDRNTANWSATATGDSPAYLDTFVEDGVYDIGALSGDITYEFVVLSNPDETEASMALIGRRGFGDTAAGIKYEQWNNTGTYGATLFGVVDLDFGVPTAPGEYTVLAFVSSEDASTTTLYVNGVNEGSVDRAITLSGLVGIGYGAQEGYDTDTFDNFDGSIFGVAIYDEALSDDVIAKHSDSYFTPIAISDPNLLIHYDFESGEGLTVLDRSGHGNHSLFIGTPEWATGIFGGALAIESADVDYIQTLAPLNIVTNTITVAGWVKHDETPAAWSGILTHRGTEPGSFGLQHNGSEGADGAELRYMWGADVYWDFSSGLLIPNGEWYFAAITIAPDQAKFYLNGVGAGQTATNVAEHVLTNFDSEIRVARDHDDGRIMTCLIDEVRFYDKTLTDVEILQLMGTTPDVTAPGDVVKGVPDEPRDGSVAGWPDGETPDLATDDDIGTKFLHFKGELEPTGIQVEPASGPSIVTGLTLTTANDSPERDPISFELSGSNESIDGPYELIASGDIVDFAQEVEWPRFTMNATLISFENDVAYKYYQVMFPTVRDPGGANSMQIAEVELLGTPAPVASWEFDGDFGGTPVGDIAFEDDPVRGQVLSLPGGDDQYVDLGSVGISGTMPRTITVWAKADHTDIPNWTLIFGFTGDENGEGGNGSHFNIGSLGGPGGVGAHVWGWEETIFSDEESLDWHHYAMSYDGTTIQYYGDGVPMDTDLGKSNVQDISASADRVHAGSRITQASSFPGKVDDARIYKKALSALDIRRIVGPIAGAPVEASLISVVRSNGVSGDRDPVGPYDGDSAPLATEAGGLMDGNIVFSDRTYPWAGVPAEYVGSEYIRTYNSDKNGGTTDVTYEVTISRPAIVWVTIDDRIPAEWDAGGAIASPQDAADYVTAAFAAPGTFTDTGIDLFVREKEDGSGDRPMSVYAAELDAGTYVFGSMDSGKNFYSIGAVE